MLNRGTTLLAILAMARLLPAQAPPLDGRDGRDLALDQFRPRTTLRVAEHLLPHAKYPCVDVHVHPLAKLRGDRAALARYVQTMDEQRIAVSISLDGGLSGDFQDHAQFLGEFRDRFVPFTNVDFQGSAPNDDPAAWACNQPDFGPRAAERLRRDHELGARGLKIFKSFGLELRDSQGRLLRVDDPRWDPIWEASGRLGMPVLIHVADPVAFFEPIDQANERWEELHRHPDWSFHGRDFPTHEDLLGQLLTVVRRHPRTTFIAAHFANNAEDLAAVGRWLDAHPNLHVDIASRINELGRQPFTARAFFLEHPDRILFGTDGPWPAERITSYWRFHETRDEYFPYSEKEFPPQGFWRIYGLDLPDDVLRNVYYENAERIIPGVKEARAKVLDAWSKEPAASTPGESSGS